MNCPKCGNKCIWIELKNWIIEYCGSINCCFAQKSYRIEEL